MSYVPLWCKSNFSFLEGASHPDELVEQAHAFGLPALALTDRDGVQGMVRAHVKARELGVSLIVGAEVTVGDGDPAGVEANVGDRCHAGADTGPGITTGTSASSSHLRAARNEPDRLRQPLPVDHHRPPAAARRENRASPGRRSARGRRDSSRSSAAIGAC